MADRWRRRFRHSSPDGPDDRRGTRPAPARIPLRLIVPNLITVLAICAGLTGVRLAFEDRFELAVAMVLLRRLSRRHRRPRGAADEGDLEVRRADGFACRHRQFRRRAGAGPLCLPARPGRARFGWIAALIYAIAAGLRLARFNVMARARAQGRMAVGLSSSAFRRRRAPLVLLPVYLGFLGMPAGRPTPIVAPLYTVPIALPAGQPPAGLVGQVARRAHAARPRAAGHARRWCSTSPFL